MARLRSGILGNVRGKVAGVVGSQWKSINYVREYVLPANPNTAAQQVQRALMAKTVVFAKQAVGSIFNGYTDKFQKAMSGFNFFIKRNIAEFIASPTWANIKVTEGKLNPVITGTCEYTTGTGVLACAFDKNLGANGLDSDSMFGLCWDLTSLIMYFPAAEVDRSTETISMTLATGIATASLKVWLFPIKYSNTLVDIIGNSSQHDVSAP